MQRHTSMKANLIPKPYTLNLAAVRPWVLLSPAAYESQKWDLDMNRNERQ